MPAELLGLLAHNVSAAVVVVVWASVGWVLAVGWFRWCFWRLCGFGCLLVVVPPLLCRVWSACLWLCWRAVDR